MEIKEVYEKLESDGLIEYGKKIPIRKLEILLKGKMEDGWSFLGPYIALTEYMREQGYFVTSRMQGNGSLKILEAEEMAFECDKTQKKLLKKAKSTIKTMNKADVSQLTDLQQAKHQLAANKLIIGMNAMRSSIARI